MKGALRKIVKAIPPLYRHINRRRGWRIHDADNPLPTVTIGGDGGAHNYGAWDIPTDFSLSTDSIVYSAGIGFDISFDLEIIRRFGCNVYAFDPGEEVVNFLEKKRVPERFKFQKIALGVVDGMHAFNKSVSNSYSAYINNNNEFSSQLTTKKLKTLMSSLGHDRIDLLKMDIEGFEYDVIDQMLEMNISPKCILVEFHHKQFGIPEKTRLSVAKLKNAGYRNFWISDLGAEYGFLRT